MAADPQRPRTAGKYFRLGSAKHFLKAVTYGPFPPVPEDDAERTRRLADLAAVRDLGANTLRLYEVPSEAFVEDCAEAGLRLLLTLPWAHHVDFFANHDCLKAGIDMVRETVERFRGNPTIAAYLVGNEIPSPLVRWMGPGRVKKTLETLIEAGRAIDPEALFSYANYPSTEYLNPENSDFMSFNVFLEDRHTFTNYLGRLQNLAGDKPLVITEFGLDSQAHGVEAQAEKLDWYLEECCRAGTAGATVYAWSDRWYRGEREILEWDFGITSREGNPKPAYDVVRRRWSGVESPADGVTLANPPKISVVVCTYQGHPMLEGCLRSLQDLKYPDYEVLLVNDGGTPSVAELATRFPGVRHLPMEHLGLSAARNLGAMHAAGDIIVYTDDDCAADEDWLTYLAVGFEGGTVDALGGPNIPPPPKTFEQACVAAAPGGPSHVLLTDREAEHVPGCNLAVRKAALDAIGGFRKRFWVAGDDVDFCWRLEKAGYRIGFHGGAMVWHYRRFSIQGYFKQQIGYGKAEAILIPLHPERFGVVGGARWKGYIYDQTFVQNLDAAGAIYQGIFGYAPYQAIYGGPTSGLGYIFSSFQWIFLAFALGLVGLVFFLAALLSAAMLLLTLFTAMKFGWHARIAFPQRSWRSRLCVSGLALVQPVIRGIRRYFGSLPHTRLPLGLPLLSKPVFLPRLQLWNPARLLTYWSEGGLARDQLLARLKDEWEAERAPVSAGDGWQTWDLQLSFSIFWTLHLATVSEYHSQNRVLTRIRIDSEPTGLTILLRFFLILAAGLLWKLGTLTWPLGLALAALFSAPVWARYGWYRRIQRHVGERAAALGFDVMK